MLRTAAIIILAIILVRPTFGQTVFATYSGGDIPTNNLAYSGACNGPATTLTVTLPAGGPYYISGVDVSYDMTATTGGGGWTNEQESMVYCQTTATGESQYYDCSSTSDPNCGSSTTGQTITYNRTGVSIANGGPYAGGSSFIFEMRAYRTWTGTGTCNTTVQKVDNNTWSVTINYGTTPPPGPGGVNDHLQVWLDAGSGFTPSAWTAKDNNAHVYSQGTASRQPASVSNSINFNDAIQFSEDGGAEDNMTCSSFGIANGDNTNSFYAISKDNGTVGWTALYGFSATAWSRCDINSGSNWVGFSQFGPSGQGVGQNGAYNISTPYMVAERTGGANTTAYFNGISTVSSWSPHVMSIPEGSCGIGSRGALRADVAEILVFDDELTATEHSKVQSYLAIKYGLTLGTNGTSMDYMGSDGTVIWDQSANAGYNYDITGISRDDVSLQDQTKSQSVNTTTTLPFTIAHSSISTPLSFGSDEAYALVGHDNGDITSNPWVSYNHGSDAIEVELNRVWCIQTTNLPNGKALNEIEVQFDMSNVPGLAGGFGLGAPNTPADLRLLLDDNATFGQGTVNEKSYSNSGTSGNLINFTIPTSDLPANGSYFFTIGSVDKSTAPLPVTLLGFEATCNSSQLIFKWSTVEEVNNESFAIWGSKLGAEYTKLQTIPAFNTSGEVNDYISKLQIQAGDYKFFRLTQTDIDGTTTIIGLTDLDCYEFEITVYPNPTDGNLNIGGVDFDQIDRIEIINGIGQRVKEIRNSGYDLYLDVPTGIYSIRIISIENKIIHQQKLIKK